MDFFSWPYSESDISQHHQKFGGQFDKKNHCCAIFGKSKTYLETRNINLIFKAISFPKFLVNARQSGKTCVCIYIFSNSKTVPRMFSSWHYPD